MKLSADTIILFHKSKYDPGHLPKNNLNIFFYNIVEIDPKEFYETFEGHIFFQKILRALKEIFRNPRHEPIKLLRQTYCRDNPSSKT